MKQKEELFDLLSWCHGIQQDNLLQWRAFYSCSVPHCYFLPHFEAIQEFADNTEFQRTEIPLSDKAEFNICLIFFSYNFPSKQSSANLAHIT